MDQDVLQMLADKTAWESTEVEEVKEEDGAEVSVQAPGGAGDDSGLADKKRDIVRRAENTARKNKTQEGRTVMEELLKEWQELPALDEETDRELLGKLEKAQKDYNERQAQRDAGAAAKQELVEKAKELSGSEEFKQTAQELKALMDSWKMAGSAGTDRDEILWQQFNDARQVFYDRRKAYFEEMDAKRASSRTQKGEIIQEASAILENPGNWKQAGERMNALFDRWKAAGSAGRDFDEELWQQYTKIRNEFKTRRQAFFNEMDAKRQETMKIKTRLIEEADAIAGSGDTSAAAAQQMKELDAQWKQAGSAGKEHDEELWQQYRAATDSFWNARRAVSEQRHSEWQAKQDDWKQRMNTALSRKQKQISDLQDQIHKLKERTGGSFDIEKIERYTGYINEKEEAIRGLKRDIQDIRTKLEAADAKNKED